MYVVALTKEDLLMLDQQQVIVATYMSPRRNKGFSTLPHTNSNTLFLSSKFVGRIQDPPQSALPADTIPSITADPIYWDGQGWMPSLLNRTVVTDVTPSYTNINIDNNILSFDNNQAVQDITVEKEQI